MNPKQQREVEILSRLEADVLDIITRLHVFALNLIRTPESAMILVPIPACFTPAVRSVMASSQQVAKQPLRGQVAVVCGGSKGIRKATAEEFLRLGGSVCLNAREADALQRAAAAMAALSHHEGQFVDTIACDATDMERLQPQLDAFVAQRGVPYYLLNVVGYAYPQYLDRLTLADFRRNMDVNYYGQLVPILSLLPHFLAQGRGHIANVASPVINVAAAGYATYVPTKYAIIGLSETLRNELKPRGIRVSILYPPDTDTPGFATENETKPASLAYMADRFITLMSPEKVAEVFVAGLLAGDFEINAGDARWLRPVSQHVPGLTRKVLDHLYARARRETGET